jgi:hypothetical protein
MILEIRTYRLKPGTRGEFVRVMRDEAVSRIESYHTIVIEASAEAVAALEA